MKVHNRNLHFGIVIGTTLLLFLASAFTVALQTPKATQKTTVSSNQNSGNQNVSEEYGRRPSTRAKATTVKSPGTKPPSTTQTEPKPAADANDPGGQRSGTGTTPPQKPPSGWTPPAQGPQWEAPKLVADKPFVQLGEPVRFKLDGLSDYVRTHYSFVIDYDDGSTEPLDPNGQGSQHPFRSPRMFNVSAKAIPTHSDAPTGEKQLESIPITVERVVLSVDKPEVEVGVIVTLTAKSVSNDPNVQYRFVFDDGNQTEWRGSKEATYQYSAARTYNARVEVGFPERGGIVSVDKSDSQIIVREPPPDALVFDVPPQVNANEQVTLSAKFPANGRHIQYRFVFDDGTPPVWQDDATATHSYGEGRTYHPYVEVGFLRDQPTSTPSTPATIATSPSKPLVVVAVATEAASPTQPSNNPGPTRKADWRDYLVPILIAFVVLLILVIFSAGAVGAYKAVKWAFAPRPTFVPHIDLGRAGLAQGSAMPLIKFELHLDPNAGNGSYEIMKSGPTLIGAERSHP